MSVKQNPLEELQILIDEQLQRSVSHGKRAWGKADKLLKDYRLQLQKKACAGEPDFVTFMKEVLRGER